MTDQKPLAGRVAIITGGSRGIGFASARLLADDGASVVVSGRDSARLDAANKELEAAGAAVLAVPADATRREDAERLVEATRERFGRIDVLVNNAGLTRDQLLVRMKDEDWDQVMDTNLRGVFLMTRAVGKVMMRQRSGRIINVSSTAGAMGNAGQVNYSAAKAGVIGLTKAAARELAHWNVLVNAVGAGTDRNRHDRLATGGGARGPARAGAAQAERHRPRGRPDRALPGRRRRRVHHWANATRQRRAVHVADRPRREPRACVEFIFGQEGFMAKPVEERVKEIICEQLGVEDDEVIPNAKFIEDLGADSLDTVELVMAFEEEFDLEIPDEDAEKIVTVNDAISYIKENQ